MRATYHNIAAHRKRKPIMIAKPTVADTMMVIVYSELLGSMFVCMNIGFW